MNDIKRLLPCSKCGVFPSGHYDTPVSFSHIRTEVKIRCPRCGKAVLGHNFEQAGIDWNHLNKKKCMAIIEFKDHHYERVDWLYNDSGTGKIRFTVNDEVYLYDPNYFEDDFSSICCGVRDYIRRSNCAFLKRDESIGKFYITDNIIQLLISKTDEGIEELEHMLRIGKEKEKQEQEENEMKDVLEIVGKIEELLMKSRFEWLMAYDPKEKAWNFQIKEK